MLPMGNLLLFDALTLQMARVPVMELGNDPKCGHVLRICPRIAQRAVRSEPILSRGCFTAITGRLPATFAWFQNRTWKIVQSRSRGISRITEKEERVT
jgi:hypothetical protein